MIVKQGSVADSAILDEIAQQVAVSGKEETFVAPEIRNSEGARQISDRDRVSMRMEKPRMRGAS
jgi:hypothetical protein